MRFRLLITLYTTTTSFHHTVTTLSLYDQISTSKTTSLQHLKSLLPPTIIAFCYFILNSTRNKFHWLTNLSYQFTSNINLLLPLHASQPTPNSWHYNCPRSVCCRSIVFLVVVWLFEIYRFIMKIFTYIPYNRCDKNRKRKVPCTDSVRFTLLWSKYAQFRYSSFTFYLQFILFSGK